MRDCVCLYTSSCIFCQRAISRVSEHVARKDTRQDVFLLEIRACGIGRVRNCFGLAVAALIAQNSDRYMISTYERPYACPVPKTHCLRCLRRMQLIIVTILVFVSGTQPAMTCCNQLWPDEVCPNVENSKRAQAVNIDVVAVLPPGCCCQAQVGDCISCICPAWRTGEIGAANCSCWS